MEEPDQLGPWQKALRYAGCVTAGYVLCGCFWFVFLDAIGAFKDSEIGLDVMWLVVPISAVVVFPCGFVLAGMLFSFLPANTEMNRGWRAWCAGIVAAPLVFSPFGEWIAETLQRWAGGVPAAARGVIEFLVILSPVHTSVALAMTVTWVLRRRRRPMLP